MSVTPSEKAAADSVLRTQYQKSVAAYWNTHQHDPLSLRLGEADGLYHHHCGLGAYDPAVLKGPRNTRDQRVLEELHRLESAQADVLLDHLGPIRSRHRVLDAGSGRGGTALMAHARFGCEVEGVSISEYEVAFATDRATRRGVADRVRFHFRNMLDSGFTTGSMRSVWTNESTMYVELPELYAEVSRLLGHGGRYVCVTGCSNDAAGLRSRAVSRIDEHYVCNIHPRSAYFRAMAAHHLVPLAVVDLTAAALPYWELRARSSVATGIEEAFLEAYREGSFHYLLIAADRI
ncbi:geranyl diphosphate 2-C-methyltransferase [Streptomyces sp. 4N509B]|uniref:geranyl diphosphate 2-C-methyltransferase n=1 Tax=Streptomyces sp. 4N509B TaxID=3457413 RepID=UPI003FD48179